MAKKTASAASGPMLIKPERKVRRSEHFVSIYTNDTQVQTTPWDVRLIFGQIEVPPTAESKVIEVVQIADVRMSPQHAKRILRILQEQLKGYEERIGAIPLVD